jgi:hypothetical protein
VEESGLGGLGGFEQGLIFILLFHKAVIVTANLRAVAITARFFALEP